MIKAFFLAIFCLLGSWCLAQPPPEDERGITWMHADFPPLRITVGRFAGMGPSDMIHDLMRRELPEYHHRIVTANLARTLEEIRNGRQVLSVGLIPNPERQRVALFSLPCVLTPPIALIVRQEDRSRWPGTASVTTFIENGRLGISRSRSYGPTLDAALQKVANHDRLFIDSSDRLFENLLKMLMLRRIDGILGYPFEAMYNARVAGMEDRIAVVPLAEGGEYVVGRIAAPRTDWGAEMIVRLNRILIRARPEPAYREAFTRWLPAAAHGEFDRVYEAQFLRQR